VPLGGYVAFPDGEDEKSGYRADDPDLLNNRPLAQRAVVISAGVAANIVFALAVLLLQVSGAQGCWRAARARGGGREGQPAAFLSPLSLLFCAVCCYIQPPP
jgi:membrane-associated protease RseP (regulator of RpoE activity)